MLDAEARMLLDLMDAATKSGRPKLETLPHAIGRQAVDKMSEDSEADPPEVAETIDGAFDKFEKTLRGKLFLFF